MRVFVLSVVCALALFSLVKATNTVGHPIAIVPGIIGTALHAEANNIPKTHIPLFCPRNHKEFSVWVNLLFDFDIKCFRHYLKLNYSAETDTWEDTPGVTVTVPKEGTMFAIDVLDEETTKLIKYFRNFKEAFENLGYQDGVNMTACGYDWRHTPSEEWAAKCRGYIEKMVESSGKKAILIGHSMGGPYSYYLLRSAPSGWVEKYIHKYITASPAWMGATRALDAMFTGVGHMLPAVLSDLFAPLARTIAGLWFLLPWKDAYQDIPIVKTPNNSYTSDDMVKVLTLQGLADVDLKYKSARSIFTKFNNFDMLPNIPVITSYGTDLDTMHTLVFDEELTPHDPDADWKHPDHLYGSGDGTVPEISLSYATNKWKKLYPDRNITYFKVVNTSHIDIVTHEPFINMVINEAFNDY